MVEQEFQLRTVWFQNVLFPLYYGASSRRGRAVVAQRLLWTHERSGSEMFRELPQLMCLLWTKSEHPVSYVSAGCLFGSFMWLPRNLNLLLWKGDLTYQGISQCFHLAALWLWANYFFSLCTSVSLSVKWDSIHIPTMVSNYSLSHFNISEKNIL